MKIKAKKLVGTKNKKPTRKTLTYTAKHFINLEVGFFPGDGKNWESFFMLNRISSDDEFENELLGEDGKFQCWDADVFFEKKFIVVAGADQPGGANGNNVIIKIPRTLLKTLIVENEM